VVVMTPTIKTKIAIIRRTGTTLRVADAPTHSAPPLTNSTTIGAAFGEDAAASNRGSRSRLRFPQVGCHPSILQ
jgi:hypothetical protein